MDNRWKDVTLSFEERARILVSQMTLSEKVSQMTYYSSAVSRFGIAEYNWWNEALHGVARAGVATVFPQAIGMAASFDEALMGEVASVIGDETRIKHHAAAAQEDRGIYKGLTMWSPNINIFRDPRWGRGHETYGEDPYLTGRMGVAFVKGLQGDDPKYLKCVATAKHYAVHSGPEALRHAFDAVATRKDMNETYLAAFRTLVKEGGVQSVMGAYNRVNGEASCASPTLLQDYLRDQWGFDGCVVSDCGAIEDIHLHHKLAPDGPSAAALSVQNGCDLCCGKAFTELLEAAERGLIKEEAITQSAYRLLLARFRLGLFDPPEGQPYTNLPYLQNDCKEHHQLSLKMAEETLVLLKNDGTLPLNRGKIKTLAVIGPNADSREALLGNYNGTASETFTVLEGMRALLPDARILFAEGSALNGGSQESFWGESATYRLAEAITAASLADAVVVVVGLNGIIESEEGSGTGDRPSMDLPESQRMLLDVLRGCGKPMAIVNMTGSATILPDEGFGAILQAWYPGQMGGLAIARALLGDANPSGRLPVTFYKDFSQLPPFEDYSMQGRTYRYLNDAPAYPFGFGLSYTRFAYSNLLAVRSGDVVTLTFSVKNAGDRAGREVCQVYASYPGEPCAPLRRLAAIRSVTLLPGDAAKLSLTLGARELSLYDANGDEFMPKDRIDLFVGGGQPDEHTTALLGTKPLTITV